jgi:hypothetical protein
MASGTVPEAGVLATLLRMADGSDSPQTVRSTLEGYAAMGLKLPMADAVEIADMYEAVCRDRDEARSRLAALEAEAIR